MSHSLQIHAYKSNTHKIRRKLKTNYIDIINTRVGNVLSSYHYIRSSVVQGSCLGPLLFVMYINDITDIFNAHVNCKLYADDVKLYTEVKSGDVLLCFQKNV